MSAEGVSARRLAYRRAAPLVALLRACHASPLVVCAAGDRGYTPHERRGGVARVLSPSRSTEFTSGRSVSPAELTTSISGCLSGEELLLLVEQHLTAFNYINASAALTKLAKLHPVEQWNNDARTQLLLVRAGELLDKMGGRQLANSAWACSKLGVTPAWLPRWVELTTRELGTMKPQELSNSVYALGGFCHSPGDAWLRAFYTASLDMSAFNPQALSNILYSLALLKEVPDALWTDAFWSASKEKMAKFKPQQLSNIVWAAASLGVPPPADWMIHFWNASKSAETADFIPQYLSNIIWAAAAIGQEIVPPSDWMTFFWAASREKMELFTEQGLSNTI